MTFLDSGERRDGAGSTASVRLSTIRHMVIAFAMAAKP